jgi:hypothetical protein
VVIHKVDLIIINSKWRSGSIPPAHLIIILWLYDQLIIFNMKKDKTSMSSAVLHMLKMQIKAEANQLREIRQPQFTIKTPTQKRHFYNNFQQETMPLESLTPNASKKHFFNLSFTESPHKLPKQRKHFEKQYRDQFYLSDMDKQ